jgi:riboflavin kinase / FMN adenylyltransferase
MAHVTSLYDIHLTQPSLVAIGVFDGVHVGHQALIRALVERAHASGRLTVVLTFFPHPDTLLRGLSGAYYLMTPQQRAEALQALGVDMVVTQTFDEGFRQTRAEAYVRLLAERMRMAELWVGQQFALGFEREGDVAFLAEQGKRLGYSVHAIELVADAQRHVVSSTAIRELLRVGEVGQVTPLLGRPFAVEAEVVQGDQRGRTIGFPTANLAVWDELLLPARGVYAGWATVEGVRWPAVTNIGVRPTFDGQRQTVEAHLLDFAGDLYGKSLNLTFEFRLRGEQKFGGIEALVAQIRADVEAGRRLLGR